jgi:hypothetical protein
MKKIFLSLLVLTIFLTGCTQEEVIYRDPDEEYNEVENLVYEDFKLKSYMPRSTYKQYKFEGPGSVKQAEEVFTEYYSEKGWSFDIKEVEPGYNVLYFKNGNDQELRIYAGKYGATVTLVIVEEPY